MIMKSVPCRRSFARGYIKVPLHRSSLPSFSFPQRPPQAHRYLLSVAPKSSGDYFLSYYYHISPRLQTPIVQPDLRSIINLVRLPMARPAGSGIAPHTFQQGNQVNPMDMSPPNSPVGLDDTMRQLGTGYALHTSATHRPFLRQPQDDLARSIHHMDIRDPINGGIPTSAGAVVPRGLNPSPLVLPSQSVQAQNWALVQRQAGYGGVYGDAADFANPYMGQRGVTRAADEAYAYCFDRGDGEYTRLIPADMLPEMQDVPRRQRGADGMIVLPVPGGRAPRGVQGVTCPVRFKVSNIMDRHLPHLRAFFALDPVSLTF